LTKGEQTEANSVTTRPDWWLKAWEVAPRSQRTRHWAEAHIIITQGAIKGPFRLANNPLLGPCLDLMEHPDVRETTWMKGVQTGISQCLQIDTAKDCHTDPGPSLVVLPSKDAGRQQMKKRWRPLLTGKGCPVLRQYQRKRRTVLGRPKKHLAASRVASSVVEDDTDRTTYENIVGSNGFDLLLGYSGSVQSLASNTCKKVRFDEVDKFNDWDADEATPVDLGRARTETFPDVYKIAQVSTPTTELGSIYLAFEASDIKLYPFIGCPKCRHAVQLQFETITIDLPPAKEMPDARERARLLRKEPHRVWIECGHCHEKIDEAGRIRLLSTGWLGTLDQGWQLHADGREQGKKPWGTTVGVHFPTMASAMGASIVTIAANWIAAEGNAKKIQDCKNKHHGVPFIFDLVKPAKGLLRKKCRDDEKTGWKAPPSMKLPTWASRVLMTIDTQKDKFYYVIRAWGARMRSRKIASGEAFSFEQLEELIYRRRWANEDPTLPSRMIALAAIDSGGGIDGDRPDTTRTQQVYAWVAIDPVKRLALKGVSSKRYEGLTVLRQLPFQSPKTGELLKIPFMWVNPLGSGDQLASFQRSQLPAFNQKTGEVLTELDIATGELIELKVDQWELDRDTTEEYLRHHDVMQRKLIKRHGKLFFVWKEDADGARHDYYDDERYQVAIASDPTYGCGALPTEAEIRRRVADARAEAGREATAPISGIPLRVPTRR
jgi:phage terminase large subunit GpA-like protein